MARAAQGKIHHTVKTGSFEQINENLELLRTGDIGTRRDQVLIARRNIQTPEPTNRKHS